MEKPKDPIKNHTALPIGSCMILTEHKTAIAKLGGDGVGNIELPKKHCQYTGKVIQVSDTHVIQQVGKNLAIAHDVSKLGNGKEILALAEKGKLRGSKMKIAYNENQGQATPLVFHKDKSIDVVADARIWADKNLTALKSRDAFVKHIETFVKAREKNLDFTKIAAPIQKIAKQPSQAPKR